MEQDQQERSIPLKNLCKFFNDELPSGGRISISGQLEAYVGNYYVSGEGSFLKETFLVIYFGDTIDPEREAVETIKKNIMAYMTSDYKYAFVLEPMLSKFKEDTKEYNITYIPVGSFEEPEFFMDDLSGLPEFMKDILWIDDDFLSDANREFDQDAFEIIDSGVDYLNPKHFSVRELVQAVKGEST